MHKLRIKKAWVPATASPLELCGPGKSQCCHLQLGSDPIYFIPLFEIKEAVDKNLDFAIINYQIFLKRSLANVFSSPIVPTSDSL